MEKQVELQQLKQKLKNLKIEYVKMKAMTATERKTLGKKLNQQKTEILKRIQELELEQTLEPLIPIDLTAPAAPNQALNINKKGTKHPLVSELYHILDIYANMGFSIVEARQLDDEFHMFDSLNFPKEHPARDDYDTFRTEEGFIPAAHTSTMQYRVLKTYAPRLKEPNGQIAVVIPGRVFRNEDIDATHEHTFHQCEGVFVSKEANLGNMMEVLADFFSAYYGEKIIFRTQPGYFPFTEPSLEFLIKKPAIIQGKNDDWLEMLGCGMVHPRVLQMAGIDPEKYRGFAWGGGIERLVMIKYGISDIRHFEAGKLDFLLKGGDLC